MTATPATKLDSRCATNRSVAQEPRSNGPLKPTNDAVALPRFLASAPLRTPAYLMHEPGSEFELQLGQAI